MSIRIIFFVILGKCIGFFIRFFSLGNASTWPGEIVLRIHANFIHDIAKKSKIKIILISGTNGKTTTAKLLSYLLKKEGEKVIQNLEGANLLNGVASSIIKHADFLGNLNYDTAVFEIDENSFSAVVEQTHPFAIILLNLFRDQLDRYGEVRSIVDKWKKALGGLPAKTKLFLNGDDPELFFLGQKTGCEVYYFGVSEEYKLKKEIPHDVDSVYCPNCGGKLDFSLIAYSHLGNFRCISCDFIRKNVEAFESENIAYSLAGVYNIYNTNAVLLCAEKALAISLKKSISHIGSFTAAFGRQEVIRYKEREFFLLLSKNPTGFNQSIQLVKEKFSPDDSVLLVLNDRIPDGTDVSWIWDVDFEELTEFSKRIFISGDRAYDLAIRLRYSSSDDYPAIHNIVVVEDMENIIEKTVTMTPAGKKIIVLPTYSAMLEVRNMLVGKKIL